MTNDNRLPSQDLVTLSFDEKQKLTVKGIKVIIAEKRGDLRVIERIDTLERRIQSELELAMLYAAGELYAGHEGAPAQRDPRSPEWAPYASMIAAPVADASAAAQRSYHIVATLIAHLRHSGFSCLRPRAALELHYKGLLSRIGEAAKAERDGSLVPSTTTRPGHIGDEARHLWALLKEHQPKGSPRDMQWPALSTVYAWSLLLDKSGGDTRAILPRFQDRGGRGKHRLLPSVEKALVDSVEAIRRNKDLRITPVELENQANNRLVEQFGHEFKVQHGPSRSTCSRIVKTDFSAYETCLRNRGPDAAKVLWRSWYPRDRASRPLEVAEFDDKDSRVFLIDEETNLPHGRAYVTCGVDQYEQMPLGFSISEQSRSTWSALSCMVDSILPKDLNNDHYALVRHLELPWGKTAIAIFDNATYNHVADISATSREANVIPAWATPYTPTEKACIEYFNGRMDTGYFSTLGGYGGPKKSMGGLKAGVESAVEDRTSFIQGLMKWSYGVFANEPGVDGYARWERWRKDISNVSRRFPLDIYRLRISPTLRHSVQLRPEGVLFTGLIYWSDSLHKIAKVHGSKTEVQFRYNPRDMSVIYVLDPSSKTYFEVPSCNPEYTKGLTLYQHRLVRKMARIRAKRNPSVVEMLRERAELQKLVSQSKRSRKLRDRKWAGKVGQLPESNSAGSKQQQTEPEQKVVTQLEDSILNIDEIEMESQEEGWEVPRLV